MYGFTVGWGGVRYGRKGSIVGGVMSGFGDVEREGGKTEYLTNPTRDLVESPTLSSIGLAEFDEPILRLFLRPNLLR